ncbi:MAG: MFS transporter, partial [Ignisphaera sp.]
MVKVGSAMLSHRTYVSVMVAMLIATTVGSLSVFVIGTVARPIMDDLELGYGTMGVVISMQRVASTLTAPFIGYAIDRIGPFKVLTIAMVFSTFSLFLTPLSSKLWMLLLTRIIAGLVFPAYWPSCTKIAAVSIPKNRIGFATAVFESGSVIGVVLTYILIPYARSWRFLFIIVAVIALLSLIMVSLLLPRNPKVEYRYLERNRDSVVKDIGYSKLFRNTIIIFFAFLFALQPWAFYTSWLSTFLVE